MTLPHSAFGAPAVKHAGWPRQARNSPKELFRVAARRAPGGATGGPAKPVSRAPLGKPGSCGAAIGAPQ
jgi:hypothetical protein